MFWHGAPLSRIERLCMASFLAQGHPLDLYVYETPAELPTGVRLMGAEEILPRALLFTHRRTGSLGSFSDWFRYRLLKERGGIWVDADVVCLAPLIYPQAQIFGWQDAGLLNNAVLGLPAGDALAAWLADCCEDPNRILPYDPWALRLRKLRRRFLGGNRLDKAQPVAHFYPVKCEDWRRMFTSNPNDAPLWNEESRAVHLWQQMMKTSAGFDKNAHFPQDSPFEALCRRYLQNE